MARQIRLDQIDDVMREAVEDLVAATTLQWTVRVKVATPVETGRLRAAWQTDIKPLQGTVTNNVAAVKHRQAGKSNDDIKAMFEGSNTPESKYNLGLVYIEEGKYEEAITSMMDNKSFNLALANLLAEHNDVAEDVLYDVNNGAANSSYLKAIIGSRTGNIEMVTENLKLAFDKDPSLKDKAKKDREFIKFFENADFLAIF